MGGKAVEILSLNTLRAARDAALELDRCIRSYFDTIGHAKLREIVGQRVQDGVVRRLIGKWLKAGVMEAGVLSYRREGTPQGGVVTARTQKITSNLRG
jgi:RNA-directed DNA polymerase